MGGYDDLEYESNKWANYTNLALSAASNPVQDFAVGVNQLVTNLTAIGLTGLEFEELTYTTFGVGMPTLHVYSASAMPKEVTVIEGNLVTPIPAGSYVTTAAAFTACSAPCVYGNSANKSVIVKAPSTMPEVVDVYITPIATNSGPPIWPVLMVMAMFVIAALYWKQKRR